MRVIEMYVGYADHTWETTTVAIPDDTPLEMIGEVASAELLSTFDEDAEVVFVGVYHFTENEEEDDEEIDEDDD